MIEQGLSCSQGSRDLGTSSSSEDMWVRDFKANGNQDSKGKAIYYLEDKQVRDLEKKLRQAEMEQD